MVDGEYRVAADIGGTFTDVVALSEHDATLHFGKVLTTPASLEEGVLGGLEESAVALTDVSLFLNGSTIAINTILERSGARAALLTTRGFRDIYEIGRINRPESYNLFFQKHEPLIPRRFRYEVDERLSSSGEIVRPLDVASLDAVIDELERESIEALAICFINAYRNPVHEQLAVRHMRRRLPKMFVTASHELSREYREFERTSTTAANAYIGPSVSRYVRSLERDLKAAGLAGELLLVQSTGGLLSPKVARTQCVRLLESGPAAGVVGTQELCSLLGVGNSIAFDMGGTTAKAGVVLDGVAVTTGQVLIGGYAHGLPIQQAMMDIHEVGTGGGSIAFIGPGGSLRVGPRSAGAVPGPVCYANGGTQPTVTDANLVLGRLDPDHFLGGRMKLDQSSAAAAIRREVAEPLGLSTAAAADGIVRIAVTSMSHAVSAVTTERGHDVNEFVLVAYGGAGPLHATAIARSVGISRVIVPPAPGHFSAVGMLLTDLRRDYVVTHFAELGEIDLVGLDRMFAKQEAKLTQEVGRAVAKVTEIEVVRAIDMRYVGQEHSVTVTVPLRVFSEGSPVDLKLLFDAAHQRRYGHSSLDERAEIVSLRSTVIGRLVKPAWQSLARGAASPRRAAYLGVRRASFIETGASIIDAPLYARDSLLAGNRVTGPALIEEPASMTVLLPGDSLVVDGTGSLIIETL